MFSGVIERGHLHEMDLLTKLPSRHTTSYRRFIDVETTTSVYWVDTRTRFQCKNYENGEDGKNDSNDNKNYLNF